MGGEGLVLLTSVANEMEAEVVEGLLRSHKIQVLRRHREAGNYLNIAMGTSVFGVDIFVDELDFETARALINGNPKAIPATGSAVSEKYQRRQGVAKGVIRLYAILALLGLVVSIIAMLVNAWQR